MVTTRWQNLCAAAFLGDMKTTGCRIRKLWLYPLNHSRSVAADPVLEAAHRHLLIKLGLLLCSIHTAVLRVKFQRDCVTTLVSAKISTVRLAMDRTIGVNCFKAFLTGCFWFLQASKVHKRLVAKPFEFAFSITNEGCK
jgi:hypothetical protein